MAIIVLRWTVTRTNLDQPFDDATNPFEGYWLNLHAQQLSSGEILEKSFQFSPDNLTRTTVYRFPDWQTFARLTMDRALDPQIKNKTLLDVPFILNNFGGLNIDIRYEA
jgi:hypothetical protein